MQLKKILVTGAAGFIGYHTCQKLLSKNIKIYGIDNLNNYYDVKLKKERLRILKKNKKFSFLKVDISNYAKLSKIFKDKKIDYIIHLAAQAGVRYSIKNPKIYTNSNLVGFANILEISRIKKIKHLIFASTSSVYGENKKFPAKENYSTDHPISYYAATKKSNEVMAYSYSYIYNIPITGLRFFTVYGEYGRPDMALFKFCKKILENKKIELFNYGNHTRDFTHIDDVSEIVARVIEKKPKKNIPFEIFNISSNKPEMLRKYVRHLEKNLKKKIKVNLIKRQLGDIKKTHGDNKKILKLTKYKLKSNLSDGVKKFVNWYLNEFKKKK